MSKNNPKQAMIVQGADGNKIYCCVECPMKYEDKELMEMHLCVHNPEYRFLCNICGTGFKRKIHLDRHELEHLQIRPYVCELCQRPFKRKEHLTCHYNKMHESGRYGPPKKFINKMKMTIIKQNEDGSSTYECMQCPESCANVESMALHLYEHIKEYRFLCSQCGIGLKRKEHLERHMLEHQDVRPHTCDECGKAFKRKEHLNIHYNIHTNLREHVCQYCDRSFHRKDHLQKHLQMHSKYISKARPILNVKVPPAIQDEEQMVISDVIGTGLDVADLIREQGIEVTKTIIQVPLESHDPARPYACPVCFRTFKRKDHVKLHSHTHLKTKPCAECGELFNTEQQLLTHMSLHLQGNSLLESDADTSMVTIEPCLSSDLQELQESEDTKPNLLLPIGYEDCNAPVSTEDRPHKCPVCFKRFKRKQHLKAHSHVHERFTKNREASIWCSNCFRGFFTNNEFENHDCINDSENVNSQQNGFHPDATQSVDYTPIKIQQEEPIQTEQPEPPSRKAVEPQRVFVCHVCSKPFRRKDHYKIHLNIHTGERPFVCTIDQCDKGFYRKDHLQKHMQVHDKKMKKKPVPELLPLTLGKKLSQMPEITIHAPSLKNLRVLQMKVPYELVTSSASGQRRTIIGNPMS